VHKAKTQEEGILGLFAPTIEMQVALPACTSLSWFPWKSYSSCSAGLQSSVFLGTTADNSKQKYHF